MPVHLRPNAPIAPNALLPGDPGRALMLAQELLDEPRMANHARGLWGYSGATADGRQLTIQATGMGGPSAAIVLEELAELGVRRAIRVGTCGALDGNLHLGDTLVATAALSDDGTSKRLGAGGTVQADAGLTSALRRELGATAGTVVSTDLFYEPEPGSRGRWIDAGCLAVEMEAAALFALGGRLGVAVGCGLVVSDVGSGEDRERIGDEELQAAAKGLGRAAAAALAASHPQP